MSVREWEKVTGKMKYFCFWRFYILTNYRSRGKSFCKHLIFINSVPTFNSNVCLQNDSFPPHSKLCNPIEGFGILILSVEIS